MPIRTLNTYAFDDNSIVSNNIQDNSITINQIDSTVDLGPSILEIEYTDSLFSNSGGNGFVSVNGGHITITGSGFDNASQVIIDRITLTAANVNFVNQYRLNANVIPYPRGLYNVFVIKSDGRAAMRINGISYN